MKVKPKQLAYCSKVHCHVYSWVVGKKGFCHQCGSPIKVDVPLSPPANKSKL